MAYATSLHDVLREDTCKIEDIQACLDRDNSSINEVDEDDDTPLFLSLRHSDQVIKLLIKNGADVSCRDMNRRSLLMNALKCGCEDSVVKVLLEALDSSCVNELDFYYEIPPLLLAVRENRSPIIIKLLLQFGARVDFRDDNGYTPLSLALERSRDEATVKLLIKYSFILKRQNFNSEQLIPGTEGYVALASYAVQCAYEVEQMESVEVDGGRTLRQIVCEDSFPWRGVADGMGELDNVLDELLRMRVDIVYPIYFDMISIKVGKRLMLEKLQEVVSYSVEHVHSSALGKVLLHYGCVCNMAQLLSEDELLRLILAFYIPHD